MKDTDARDSLMLQRMMIGLRLLAATAAWISATTYAPEGKEDLFAVEGLNARREGVVEEFRINYWKLDPFIRARAIIDRAGMLGRDGTVLGGGK